MTDNLFLDLLTDITDRHPNVSVYELICFLELCSSVEKINKEAAAWLRYESWCRGGLNFHFSRDLNLCFKWDKSPQGSDYWFEIFNKLYAF